MFRIWIGILSLFIAVAPSLTYAGTSNSLMDVAPNGKLLLVANNDSGTVTLVDLDKKEAVREIKVGKKPEGVTWIGNGPLAAVTLYHQQAVVIIDTNTGKIDKTIKTAAEPYGIVADAKGTRAWVTHEYPGVVSEIDLVSGKVLREIPAGAMPRGIALAPDGKRIYVTEFYTAALNAIDLERGKIVDSWKGHSTDNLARHVVLHPTRPKAYVAHIRSMIKVADGAGSIFPFLSIHDLKPGEGKRRSAFGMDTFNGVYVVTNPWESAISPDGKRFYIIYAATNDMNYCKVIDDDYKEIASAALPVRIGQNPRAVRVSPDGNSVYIYNAMDFAVSVYTANMKFVKSIKTCEPPKTPEWVRGKILFNTAHQPMSQRRWVACSSCHPDGLHDARVWQQAEGLRKTTAFIGLAHTHPLHWSADRDEVQDFEYTIRSKLMQGGGFLIRGQMKSKKSASTKSSWRRRPRAARSGPRRHRGLLQFGGVPAVAAHRRAGQVEARGRARQEAFLQQGSRLRDVPQRAVLHRQQPQAAVQSARRRHRAKRHERAHGHQVRHADAARHLSRRPLSARWLGTDLARCVDDAEQRRQARQDEPAQGRRG